VAGWDLKQSARDDLNSILAYVEHESGPSAADRLLDDFIAAFEMLAANPRMGRKSDSEDESRWWLVHRYLVLYAAAEPLQILRIYHGARDLNRSLTGSNQPPPPR
jgi:plasmid stabilization system protein ParE